jgi:hypothetical protein
MSLELRGGSPDDAANLGRICFDAFKAVADRHNFPEDSSPEAASRLMSLLLTHRRTGWAYRRGQLFGRTIANRRRRSDLRQPRWTRQRSRSSVDGRRVRLVQAGYNNQTLCLYSKLGFRTREPLSVMNGAPPRVQLSGYDVRKATEGDTDACNRVCRLVHAMIGLAKWMTPSVTEPPRLSSILAA